MLELKENIRLGTESGMWIFISAFLIVLDRYVCWNVGLCSRKYGFCCLIPCEGGDGKDDEQS